MPGWYAVDVNCLHGLKPTASDGRDGRQRIGGDGYDLTYFQHFAPSATAGYSILIYHITFDEANRVRRQLGLPEIVAKGQNEKHQKAGREKGGMASRQVVNSIETEVCS
jgi:hypothetical protein